jgi:hypothetical protein
MYFSPQKCHPRRQNNPKQGNFLPVSCRQKKSAAPRNIQLFRAAALSF